MFESILLVLLGGAIGFTLVYLSNRFLDKRLGKEK